MIALDTESTGLDLSHGAKPFFVSMYRRGGTSPEFWSWKVDPLTREPFVLHEDLQQIRKEFEEADEVVLQHAKFDYRALSTVFEDMSWWDWRKVHDTLIAGHLLASNQPHDLTTMSLVYLRINIEPLEKALERATKEARTYIRLKRNEKRFENWRIAKKGLSEMPSAKESVWKFDSWLPGTIAEFECYDSDHPWFGVLPEYGCADPEVTLAIFIRQRELLKEKDLWEIYLERMKLVPIAWEMEDIGVTHSDVRLRELDARFRRESKQCEEKCKRIARARGHSLSLPKSGRNKSLDEFVFNVLKLKTDERTDSGGPSLSKSVLETWELELPEGGSLEFIKALRAKRRRDKAITDMEGYRRYRLPADDKGWFILHPSLNPTGTDTLRWSSSNPNSQNFSKQEGFNLRYCFGPAPGREWWSLDYENMEVRITAYEAEEEEMVALFELPDDPPYYGSVHLLIFDVLHPEKFKEHGAKCKEVYEATWYQWTKNGDFAVQYGSVEQSGTADKAYHVPGAFSKIKSRFSKIHGPGGLNERMIKHAEEHGYVETIPDKTVNPRRGYPIYCARTKWGKIKPTVPLNYHVQSTAMWCTAKAMVRCQEYLKSLGEEYRMVLQVHDELVFDMPMGIGKEPWRTNLPKVRKLKRLMEQSGDDIGVPLRVSLGYHQGAWSEKEKIR